MSSFFFKNKPLWHLRTWVAPPLKVKQCTFRICIVSPQGCREASGEIIPNGCIIFSPRTSYPSYAYRHFMLEDSSRQTWFLNIRNLLILLRTLQLRKPKLTCSNFSIIYISTNTQWRTVPLIVHRFNRLRRKRVLRWVFNRCISHDAHLLVKCRFNTPQKRTTELNFVAIFRKSR